MENAAHGHGITDTIAREWFDRYGVDVITTGNHAFDVKGIDAYFRQEPRLLRPANHPPDTAGNGWVKLHTPSGAEVLIINLMGRVHMPACDCPFRCVDGILQKERADLVIVDMHAEATSEAQAMGHHLDGRAAAVLGTHTHVPTLDTKVLPGGTAYVTDIGMTGPYEGVIGMKKDASLGRFLKVQRPRYEVAEGDLQLHAGTRDHRRSQGHRDRTDPAQALVFPALISRGDFSGSIALASACSAGTRRPG